VHFKLIRRRILKTKPYVVVNLHDYDDRKSITLIVNASALANSIRER
jgi:hypothetical protein